jgi:DNA modification methylase
MRERKEHPRLGPWNLNEVHNADCTVAMKQIPSDSIDVVITSPPYWGHREGFGFGSEPDPRDYVGNLISILSESLRCLKPQGTLWLNIGDAYNTPINWTEHDYRYSTLGKDHMGFAPSNKGYAKKRGKRRAFIDKNTGWLKYGNLLGIPYRVIIGLCDLGFLFRGEVIWTKSKPMPEGLCRRPHRAHEAIYIIAKNERHAFRTKPPVSSVWNLLQTPNMTPHTSAFPIDLPVRCIEASAVNGRGIILDPFMGSGTTGKAARLMGHDFLGFEIDAGMCKVARDFIFAPCRNGRLHLMQSDLVDSTNQACG